MTRAHSMVLALLFLQIPSVFSRSYPIGTGGTPGEYMACGEMEAVCICNQGFPTDGDNTGCPTGMHLVRPPTTTNSPYKISAASGGFAPGEMVTLTVEVTKPNMQYLGMLLYAVDGGHKEYSKVECPNNEQKLGQWVLPKRTGSKFAAAVQAGCEGKAIMHDTIEEKSYSERFSFEVPSSFDGESITIRALFKYGETNGGEFWWPENHLVLNKRKATPRGWYKGTSGQTCNDACAAHQLACNEAETSSVTKDVPALRNVLPSPLPFLHTCNKDYVPYYGPNDNGDEFVSVCGTSTSACSASNSNADRFCFCGEGVVVTDPPKAQDSTDENGNTGNTGNNGNNGNGGNDDSKTSSTCTLKPSNLILLLFGLGGVRASKMTVPLVCLLASLALVTPVAGHNFVGAPRTRAGNSASKTKPAPTWAKGDYHIMVSPGQPFEIEMSAAHQGSRHFYSVVKAEGDYMDNLNKINKRVLNEYLKQAPDSSKEYYKGAEWEKLHRMTENLLKRTTRWDQYKDRVAEITEGDPRWFDYNEAFPAHSRTRNQKASCKAANGNGDDACAPTLYKITERTYFPDDTRVKYTNPEWPFIRQVSRMTSSVDMGLTYHVARFKIDPEDGKGGHYCVHYLWGQYRDCIDVYVLSNEEAATLEGGVVKDKYGKYAGRQLDMIHHATFTQYNAVTSCHTFDAKSECALNQCLTECIQNSRCDGVNIVRVKHDSHVKFQDSLEIPYGREGCPAQDDAFWKNFKATDVVCYGLEVELPPFPRNIGTGFRVSNDMTDPMFYNTLVRALDTHTFSNNILVADKDDGGDTVPQHIFGDHCVSCEQAIYHSYGKGLVAEIPLWKLQDKCEGKCEVGLAQAQLKQETFKYEAKCALDCNDMRQKKSGQAKGGFGVNHGSLCKCESGAVKYGCNKQSFTNPLSIPDKVIKCFPEKFVGVKANYDPFAYSGVCNNDPWCECTGN